MEDDDLKEKRQALEHFVKEYGQAMADQIEAEELIRIDVTVRSRCS